jgi:hypothetical protein
MRHRASIRTLLAAVALALAIPVAGASAESHPLTIGISGSREIDGADATVAFARIHRSAITQILTSIYWPAIAPQSQPSSWDPTNPTIRTTVGRRPTGRSVRSRQRASNRSSRAGIPYGRSRS